MLRQKLRDAHERTGNDLFREAEQAVAELEWIKGEVVEYIHDGGDFDWDEAVLMIRQWRAQSEGREFPQVAERV